MCSAYTIPAVNNKVPIHICNLHLFTMHCCHFISLEKSSHLLQPSPHSAYSQCHTPNPTQIPAEPVLSPESHQKESRSQLLSDGFSRRLSSNFHFQC